MTPMQTMSQTTPGRPGVIARALKATGQWIGNTLPVSMRLGLEDSLLYRILGGATNHSGEVINPVIALQLSTVWACIRLISETISTLPLNVYKKRKGQSVIDDDHPLHYILHDSPNADSTSTVFLQAMVAAMLLRDGAYVEVMRTVNGEVSSLFFLYNDNLNAPYENGDRDYLDPYTGRTRRIPARNIWYTPGFTVNGITGLASVHMGANVFGGAVAADKASAATFKDGMRASGLVMMDHIMKPEQRDDVRRNSENVMRQGGVLVLEKGSSFQQLTMTPQDAQLLSTRQFNVEEVCRWFRVPPFMIGHNDKASGYPASLEAQMTMFVTMVLNPWIVRIEQSMNKFLFTDKERGKWRAKFVLEGLLRGDSASRAAYYKSMTQGGMMTLDEVRIKEDLPVKGGNADVLMVQSQMIPIEKLGQDVPDPNAPPAPEEEPPTPAADAVDDAAKALKALGDMLEVKDTQ